MNCSKCCRCNPAAARFCWFDGVPLGQAGSAGPVEVGRVPFIGPFCFPSGRACRNFDELALTCQEDWPAAAELLRQGVFEGFLGKIGRRDLALVAREAARFPDIDQGLDHFLAGIPSRALPGPRLRVEPASVHLGVLSVGRDHDFHLRLMNDGKRLLHGRIAVDGEWLRVGDGPGAQARRFQFASEQSATVRIEGKLLRASTKPLEGRVLVESNGGTVTIPITATVPAKVFTQGVLAGAVSPRELAKKAKADPQSAGPLFENGAVARWYEANGWTYPVLGPTASGLAAVQQFFEALGLVKPPVVELSEESIRLVGPPGEKVEYSLAVITQENRVVIAHGRSNQSWLQVGRPIYRGRSAFLPLTVAAVAGRPGETLQAVVSVTANGGQRFTVPVALAVGGAEPEPAAPEPPGQEPVRPVPSTGPSWRMWAYGMAGVFLLAGFLGAVVHDLLLKPEAASFAVAPLIDAQPRIAIHFHDQDVQVKLGPSGIKPANGEVDRNHIPAVWEPSMRFGVTMVGQSDPGRPGADKRLTYSDRGLTNNTCVHLDGRDVLFGESPFRLQDGKRQGDSVGRWLEMKGGLGTDSATGLKIEGWKSVWRYDAEKINVTQTVQVVPGDQSRLLDTCLVRYRIDNQDSHPHRVGLRTLLDTYIGGNDGVPFTLPGANHLCDTEMQFNQPSEVPDFIEALERPDLRNPGTIAHLGLKRSGSFDPPDRLTLGAWPNFRLHPRDHGCLQEKTLWRVPILPIKTLTPPDSAVTIYWNEKDLAPGEHRETAFTYGLGNVASGEAEGKLGVSVGGAFVEEGEFTVTAYVSHPSPDERVTLNLPDGFVLLAGPAEQAAPPLPPGAASSNSPVAWKVRAPGKAGRYVLKVRARSGVAQSQPIIIRPHGSIFN